MEGCRKKHLHQPLNFESQEEIWEAMQLAKQCCVLQEGLNEGHQNAEDCPSEGRVARRVIAPT